MTQLELWGYPWSRKKDGIVNVRRFGGMKIERTWFATDKIGFHMLHTLFQASLKYPQIQRVDEYFVLDILVDEGRVHGLVAIHIMEGTHIQMNAKPLLWPLVEPAVFTVIILTAELLPVTTWVLHYGMAFHYVIWNLSNTIRLACQVLEYL